MKLSGAVLYAVQALVDLARQEQGQLCPSHVLAHELGVSEKFLLKLLHPLARAGLLQSVRGPHGGYCLAKPARAITLLDVVEAVAGPIRGEASSGYQNGKARLRGRLEDICDQIAEQVRRQLGMVRVADLADETD
jgi:Rrf2 family protein